jgi:hypothetical protein
VCAGRRGDTVDAAQVEILGERRDHVHAMRRADDVPGGCRLPALDRRQHGRRERTDGDRQQQHDEREEARSGLPLRSTEPQGRHEAAGARREPARDANGIRV